jgi:hypothetical protein
MDADLQQRDRAVTQVRELALVLTQEVFTLIRVVRISLDNLAERISSRIRRPEQRLLLLFDSSRVSRTSCKSNVSPL